MKRLCTLIALILVPAVLSAVSPEDLRQSLLDNNPDVLNATADAVSASLDVASAKAEKLPTIDLTVTGSLIGNPMDPVRIDLSDYIDPAFMTGVRSDYITLYGGQENAFYTFSLNMTVPLLTWGKLDNQIDIYELVHSIRLMYLQDTINQKTTELDTRINVLAYLRQMEALLDDQQVISERLVELAQSAYENGFMTLTDALEIKVKAGAVNTAKAQVKQQKSLMLTEIRNLTGNYHLTEDMVEDDSDGFEQLLSRIMSLSYDELKALALSDSNLNLSMLASLAQVQKLTNEAARNSVAYKPDVALICSASYTGPRLPVFEKDWYGKDDWNATLTIALSTSIYDGGRTANSIKKTQNEADDALVDIEGAKAKILSALDENYTNIDVLNAKIAYQQALYEQEEAQAQMDITTWESGYGSEADYLQTKVEMNTAKLEEMQLRIELLQAVYTIGYLIGR